MVVLRVSKTYGYCVLCCYRNSKDQSLSDDLGTCALLDYLVHDKPSS